MSRLFTALVLIVGGRNRFILAERAIALSVTLSGGALFANSKLPIPIKFDRQGHSCNLYGGFGPMTRLGVSILEPASYP